MKILFPIRVFYPAQTGGPANTVYWLAKELAKSNEVYVVTTSKDINKELISENRWIDLNGINVVYVTNHKIPVLIYLHSFKKIVKTDVIHLNSLFDLSSLPIALFGLLFRKKIIWSVRGELEEYALGYGHFRLKKIFLSIINNISKKIIFHATSDSEVSNILNRFGEKTNVFKLPNYMILPEKIQKVLVKKQLLFVGRVHPIKSIDKLLTALAVSEVFLKSDFIFKIAGIGDIGYMNQITSLIIDLKLSHKVVFLKRRIEGKEKEVLYAESYFSFLVSESENFGAVVTEAMAQGTPVVTSKGTPWQILEKEGIGFWIDNNPEQICQIVDKILLYNNQEYREIRQKAYDFVLSNFNIENNVDKWEKEYLKT
ncbi:glycosyltransferase [Olleya sp. HaHaR_3_96]|uniref:glycosyltransferase n=1 Tax=Olleya sp. HaHaR_3_96 TaxID=2745560 RepID=UPI001C4E2F7A|nr:glycosyltransferase [Olleya sp. HaHaR_3_96]QXP60666.1 glycosyltransferase [Olleya sp. HaHaR_3_96]